MHGKTWSDLHLMSFGDAWKKIGLVSFGDTMMHKKIRPSKVYGVGLVVDCGWVG